MIISYRHYCYFFTFYVIVDGEVSVELFISDEKLYLKNIFVNGPSMFRAISSIFLFVANPRQCSVKMKVVRNK
jgi:hypothetical protein